MPELNWIGKQAVRAHHREVDFHLLKDVPELACEGSAGTPARSGEADKRAGVKRRQPAEGCPEGEQGEAIRAPVQSESGNLIVQGDNLRALKALLPRYAGQVKCIYIDPPYNTGNEGWVYNDNVKAPEMVKWLGQVVGKEAEDLSRHDKWLCMMYPRLQLLKRFLREDGSIWVSMDDSEMHLLRSLMDEVFGRNRFVACNVWQKRYSRENREAIGDVHEYIMVYAMNPDLFKATRHKVPLDDEQAKVYKNPNNDPRGRWRTIPITAQAGHATKAQFYTITGPTGKKFDPPAGNCWRYSETAFEKLRAEGRIYFGKEGTSQPTTIRYLDEVEGVVPWTWWPHEDVGHTDEATKELMALVGGSLFDTPKPSRLIQRILQIATDKDSLVLDSFAGSGTTGHAVLKQNAEDGGTRRFILVEMEEKIARTITAERVRRVVERSAGTPARSEEVEEEVEAPDAADETNEDLFSIATAKKKTKRAGVPALASEASNQRTGVSAPPSAAALMPGFRFAVLGDTLFDAEGNIRETVTFEELAEFVWFQQTGAPLPPKPKGERTPLLGIHRGTAVYLLYNGILKDKSVGGGNVLTRPVLYSLPEHDGPKVVWCAACRISELILRRLDVTPRQIPYQLEVNAWL